MKKIHRTTVVFTEEQRKAIEKMARKKGLKLGQLIRAYVWDGLKRDEGLIAK